MTSVRAMIESWQQHSNHKLEYWRRFGDRYSLRLRGCERVCELPSHSQPKRRDIFW
jgi:hypothetical protein